MSFIRPIYYCPRNKFAIGKGILQMHRISHSLELENNGREELIKQQLLWFAFFNFFLVSLIGLCLRSLPFISIPVNYKYVLHGHSHFAFGGWVMPVLTYLIMRYFPVIKESVDYKHWRNIFICMMFSAYGMLITFPIEGYAVGSIIFSTISIVAGVYLSICVRKGLKSEKPSYSGKFLQAGIIYLLMSSVGPFATGPIAAVYGTQSMLFTDAIYYFLHFQYNGFFSFVILAVLYRIVDMQGGNHHGKIVYSLFNIACIPTFFLSVLWHHPGIVYNVIGVVGATLQVIALFFLLKDLKHLKPCSRIIRLLLTLSITALILKGILQLTSGFPYVADLAFHHRNFVIAYLHLVLLGFVSLFSIAAVFYSRTSVINKAAAAGAWGFVLSLILTNTLLVIQAIGEWTDFYIPQFNLYLWTFSLLFPISICVLLVNISPAKYKLSHQNG